MFYLSQCFKSLYLIIYIYTFTCKLLVSLRTEPWRTRKAVGTGCYNRHNYDSNRCREIIHHPTVKRPSELSSSLFPI